MSSQGLTPEQVRKAESLVGRINGVRSCRISVRDGAITEIHVIAAGGKSPKFVARDVETVLKAEAGLDVDHRKIGVVIVDGGDEGGAPDTIEEFPVEEVAARFEFFSVNVFTERNGIRAEVELRRDIGEALGVAESGNTAGEPWPVIAEAALRAVSEFLDGGTRLCLGGVLKIALGDKHAFVVRVDLIEPRGVRHLAGCAIVSGSEHQSVVYATLDAVNRVVGVLEFKSSIEYRIR